MGDSAAPPLDPASLVRERSYRALLVLAAIVGVIVSLASWGFLELVHYAEVWVYEDLPGELGFGTVPTWWPLPVLALAGLVIAYAVVRLPGRGGHEPSDGLKAGPPTTPIELPGVMLAAYATIALGLVLGPEAPLIALGAGLGILTMRLVRSDAPDQALAVIAAAGSFAALSTIFGSPIIGALIIIEAAGLGGPMLPIVLLPGLLASGIGSLVFVGVGSRTGLSTGAYSITPLDLPVYARPNLADFGWTIVLAIVTAVAVFAVLELGRGSKRAVAARPFLLFPVAGLATAGLAIVFFELSDEPANLVLFSGQEAMGSLVQQADTLSLGTLALLLVFKGAAWGVSLGAARGGPTFPAIFLGIVGGLLVGHLPGFAETPAVAVLIGAACVSVLRLPLSSILLALIVSGGGLGVSPLIVVAVVVAYLATAELTARAPSLVGAAAGAPAARVAAAEPAESSAGG
jgi:chloride channel protein, CIC family